MKNAVVLAILALPVVAAADDTQTTSANTLVVVTPNAPVVIQQGPGGQQQAQAPQYQYGAPADMEAVPAPVAPQNEDWNNVSHINGSLVPVGERSQYLKKFKKANISTNPLGWMFGFYGVSASYAVSDNVAIRGDINVGKQLEGNDGVELGVSAPIYFKRTYSGPFIEPGLLFRSVNQDEYLADYNGNYGGSTMTTDTKMLVEVMFGWHWSFDSGLNVAMAFGAAREVGSSNSSDSSDDPHPAGYFRVGYEF